ncbi:MAG: DNA polymerase III subunit delta' [Anaerolineae bacterium]|nr:DNA polymerase III subunit delta' [Anaerolineae bacterium]
MSQWPVVGHRWAVQQLRHAIEVGEVPHALLITGPESVGKRTLAQQLIAAMLCRATGEERPCGRCPSCRKLASGNHPDFYGVESEDRTTHLRIEQIRDVERFLTLTPNESPCKVALISDFERATVGAANALLKTLEEPPTYAHLILLATDADLLLPTIVSRAQQIVLRPLASHEIEGALIATWGVEAGLAGRLARLAGGRIGWAVRAATGQEPQTQMEVAVEALASALREDLPSRFERAQALARDTATLAETLEAWLTFWRDVLLLQTGNEVALVNLERRDLLGSIGKAVDIAMTLHILAELDHSQDAILANANAQLLVEALMLELPTLS